MIMNTKKYGPWLVAIMIIAPFIYGAFISSIFISPGIMGAVSVFIYVLMSNLKSFEPKKYDQANDTLYSNFAVLTVAFLSVLSLILIYASSLANQINVSQLILTLVGLSFVGLGWYMPKFKQNYFVGFKLLWTLESETSWNETHKVASRLWIYGGLFQLFKKGNTI